MFREMRRKKQLLPNKECVQILENGTHGVLAVSGDDGYPYAVPLSYVFDGEKIYFHCAKSGHKLDAVKRNCKASFCVVAQDEIIPERFTTHYKSVIVFGKVKVIDDDEKKFSAILKLAEKYCSNLDDDIIKKEIENEWSPLLMLEMAVDHMTAKASKELVINNKTGDYNE